MQRLSRLLSLAVLFTMALPVAVAGGADFSRDIRPILAGQCLACHGPDEAKRQAGLRLDVRDAAIAQLDSGVPAIVPGRPDASELIARIVSPDDDLRMPPAEHAKRLTDDQVAVLRNWIEAGAPYAEHWAWVAPVRPDPPEPPADFTAWPQNDIDRFVLRQMGIHGLSPSPEADRYALVRRLFLDLTGLPPTVAEADAFVACPDPHAWELLVDDLLQRDAFGEHWARKWLDLARYADSAGYADDPPRTIWAWRDWVIRSINSNQRFDQFTIEQLAGDLLPAATESQIIATAFHRNTLTNSEGGTIDEEFRNVAIVDRVNTTMAVWMGTTMACAQCHSHKYDPLSQGEYFGLFAILNNTVDADRRDEAPVLELWSPDLRDKVQQVREKIARLKALPSAESPDEDALRKKQLEKAEAELEKLNPITTVPVLRELTNDRRETFLQHRGNWQDIGRKVNPGVPGLFHDLPDGRPADRLALAEWLVSPANPLTPRVLANRWWETLFGRGIVVTSEDFGTQGDLPTHPGLLDWLATELVRSGWDRKAMLKQIVMSATYRQSGEITPVAVAADPDNRWLSHGPRVRLSAEMVRDQVLFVSGLLSPKMYGPPVNPPQPNLGLNAAFGSSVDWKTSEGEDRHRRALYTTWRRSSPYPSMATFDAPNREVCIVRRNTTNTPLQSLVTLNDPVYVEAARSLARRALRQHRAVSQQITWAFRCCLIRPPDPAELDALERLYRDVHRELSQLPDRAGQLATGSDGELPAGLDVTDAATMTVVANVLLNLDEMFLKR